MITAGGENDSIAPDPGDPDLVFGGRVEKLDLRTLQTHTLDPTLAFPGRHRSVWTLPLVFSRRDPRVLYFADQQLFRTADGGQSWSAISPDLTREDAGAPPNLDPVDGRLGRRNGPAARRHLRDRPVSRGRPGHLGRHGRRPRLAQPRRGRPLDRRHASGSRRVVEGHDARGFAHRQGHGVGGRRPASPRRLRALHLSHGGRRQELDAFGQRAFPAAASSTRCARTPFAPASFTPAPRRACTSRSTAATPGSPSSSTSR